MYRAKGEIVLCQYANPNTAMSLIRHCRTSNVLALSTPIRFASSARSHKWHLDEVVISIPGEQHWFWRAVDQNGLVLDVLIKRRRDSRAAQRLMKKLLKSTDTSPRVMMISDKLRSVLQGRRWPFTSAAQISQQSGPRILISRPGDAIGS